jgi:DNA-binding IclR family transcriptional regulator
VSIEARTTISRQAAPGPVPAYPIESVGNALALILLFREERLIRVAEASARLGVARSTAHRLFAMLQYYGFVVQDPATRAYAAGPALIDVGLSVVGDMDIRNEAGPHLSALRDEVDETVHLAILRGRQVLFVDSLEGTRAVRVGARVGETFPAHRTATGKAMLAELTVEERDRLYPADFDFRERTGAIGSRSELEAALVEVRTHGYATNFGESEDGVSAVGVVVRDRLGRPRGAVGVSAPVVRIPPEDVIGIAEAAMRAADRIGSSLA